MSIIECRSLSIAEETRSRDSQPDEFMVQRGNEASDNKSRQDFDSLTIVRSIGRDEFMSLIRAASVNFDSTLRLCRNGSDRQRGIARTGIAGLGETNFFLILPLRLRSLPINLIGFTL